MSDDRQFPAQVPQSFDRAAFKSILDKPAVLKSFFLPPERASWEGDRYTLGRGSVQNPQIEGVHLQEPDPDKKDLSRERTVQAHLSDLVRSVIELRRTPPLGGLVLSDEALIGRQPGQPSIRRVVFGLRNPADGRFRSDADAARECHQQITRAIGRAGFIVEEPADFDPQGGFKGLTDWTGRVRLRRRPLPSPWWLLGLLPLLLLPLLFFLPSKPTPPSVGSAPATAAGPAKLFGMKLESKGFIILVDKSASMEPHFTKVRAEAKRLLNELLQRQKDAAGTEEYFAEVIVYDGDAYSAGGSLRKLNESVVADLNSYLDKMKTGGGTDLSKAIDLAAQEAARFGNKTTFFILTDGEDNSLAPMMRDKDRIKERFGKAGIVMHSTTPRLFNLSASPKAADDAERTLERFSETFNGRFGPQ